VRHGGVRRKIFTVVMLHLRGFLLFNHLFPITV